MQEWIRAAESKTVRAGAEDKAEIRRLQKELRRAQQERDILKKAVAFFARESEDKVSRLSVHRGGAGELSGGADVPGCSGSSRSGFYDWAKRPAIDIETLRRSLTEPSRINARSTADSRGVYGAPRDQPQSCEPTGGLRVSRSAWLG